MRVVIGYFDQCFCHHQLARIRLFSDVCQINMSQQKVISNFINRSKHIITKMSMYKRTSSLNINLL